MMRGSTAAAATTCSFIVGLSSTALPVQGRIRRRSHFDAVTADARQHQRHEQMIEIFDEPSADEGERAAGPRVERRERSQQRWRNDDALRRRRDVDDGAVDVEQDRDAGEVDWFQDRLPEGRLDNETASS